MKTDVPRVGGWLQSFSGAQLWPLDPRPGDFKMVDIAAGLSKACRFNSQCLRFMSVAEHSVLMSRHAKRINKPHLRPWCTMHDAAEHVLVDWPRPMKDEWPEYREVEKRNQMVIAEQFGLPWPMPDGVKDLDNRILLDEVRQNMAPPQATWTDTGATEPLGVTLQFWTPERAFYEFMVEVVDCGIKF